VKRMTHRIEVGYRVGLGDPREAGIASGIRDLGIRTIEKVVVADVYWLDADLAPRELDAVCLRLLSDPVSQVYRHDGGHIMDVEGCLCALEVTYNSGVSDPLQATILKGIADIGVGPVPRAKNGVLYVLHGSASQREIQLVTDQLLLNPVVQHVVQPGEDVFPHEPQYDLQLRHIPITELRETELAALAGDFGFSPMEMQAIQRHYISIGREPTDAELETLAQTWSEHCVHKTFKARIRMGEQVIDNLLRTTIMSATEKLNKPWCLSVFKDNAGVVDFDGENAVCFKVETHNHPSAVEPYGGAATGLGGVVRDVLGTGLGAKPILNTDVFCFADPATPGSAVPAGVLHPRRVFKGVRAGVADYGNRLGIPTINGTLRFDERYLGNPLVFCGTVGLMPTWAAPQGMQEPGDFVVLMGGRTGRDGIHGVTFASEKLDEDSVSASRSAVQIGNPIVEKRVIDVLMQARDKRLYRRITDCGGGGLSSAVGEMGEKTGVRVHLDRVPLKYAGLSYDEIWISESQERMILAVPPECVAELLALSASEGVETTVIGDFTDTHRLELLYDGIQVADMEMSFLHDGLPQLDLVACKPEAPAMASNPAPAASLTEALLGILGSLNVCSKEWVIRQYDHEVQGGSRIKPLVGDGRGGPGDAAAIQPVLDSDRGLIVSCGINTLYGDFDAYWMAASAIDEALRQIVAVGGSLDRVALLDNFCWGRVDEPESLGALVRACEACHDMSLEFGAPFISGKDSLNNFAMIEGKPISIPHTLLVSGMAVVDSSRSLITMDLKAAGNAVYLVGATYDELAGSEYARFLGGQGATVPQVRPAAALKAMKALSSAIGKQMVSACHDLSEGGIAVAAAEMAFAGDLGMSLDLGRVPMGEDIPRDDVVLFSESNSRFLVEVPQTCTTAFETAMADVPCARIGAVQKSPMLTVVGRDGTALIETDIRALRDAWTRPLDW
jgi:phosphoribosylformylglycinamidine synthase II